MLRGPGILDYLQNVNAFNEKLDYSSYFEAQE